MPPSNHSKLPKYKSIAADIIQMIESGALPVGGVSPSENEIIDRYEVSNTTARKVLQEVERRGMVKRIKGKGTIVTSRVGRSVNRILGFTRNMLEAGRKPETRTLSVMYFENDRVLNHEKKRYVLPAPIVAIERLRLADGVPMMKEIRFISEQFCPGIGALDLNGSLYDIYRQKYKLHLAKVDQYLTAIVLDRAKLLSTLDLPKPIPGFMVEGVSYCGAGTIFEMEESIYRGDQYTFFIQASDTL